MKRLTLIICLALMAGCTQSLKETEYIEHKTGKIQIDSAKFRPVLIMEDGDVIYIAEKEGVKKVEPINQNANAVLIFLLIVCISALVILKIEYLNNELQKVGMTMDEQVVAVIKAEEILHKDKAESKEESQEELWEEIFEFLSSIGPIGSGFSIAKEALGHKFTISRKP